MMASPRSNFSFLFDVHNLCAVPTCNECNRALDILLVMTALLIATIVIFNIFGPGDEEIEDSTENKKDKDASKGKEDLLHDRFLTFRNKYIAVYLVIMLADWMQGTHMYTLYLSYNVNISALFLTGFLSGAFFAPFLGSAVDKFGRKNSCIVYCVLEIIINTLEHSTDFGILLLGRVLGGISTNLLFSAFESWMTTEHRKRGFPEEWLSRTYSAASIGNGATAILAGVVSQVLEDQFGHSKCTQSHICFQCTHAMFDPSDCCLAFRYFRYLHQSAHSKELLP